MRNAASIVVREEELLSWIDFEGGIIRDIFIDKDRYGEIVINLEHHDLPENDISAHLIRVYPTYIYQREGRGIFMNRVSPEKIGDNNA